MSDQLEQNMQVWNDLKRIIWAGENPGLIEEYDLEDDPFELEGAVE